MGVIGPDASASAWAQEYARRLGQHLPPGRFYRFTFGSAAGLLLVAAAKELGRVRLAVEDAFAAVHPGRAGDAALDAWEDALGLPECGGASTEIARRQEAAWAKLRARAGGQSRAYFLELVADRFGLEGEIVEFDGADCNDDCNAAIYGPAWMNTWALVLPMTDLFECTCNDDCNDPLRDWGRDELECLVNALKPAHTRVLYWYTET